MKFIFFFLFQSKQFKCLSCLLVAANPAIDIIFKSHVYSRGSFETNYVGRILFTRGVHLKKLSLKKQRF